MAIEITPEIQEVIDRAVEESTKALKAKNDQLIAEKRKIQKGAEIDPADLERLESENEALRADLTKIQKEYKTATKELETTKAAVQSESAFTQKLLIENGLSQELINAGVKNPVNLKATQAMLKGLVQVVAEGDARIAKVGDKALSEFVKEWAASDEGKHFVDAPANGGGGAPGGGGSGNVDTSKMTAAQKMEYGRTIKK